MDICRYSLGLKVLMRKSVARKFMLAELINLGAIIELPPLITTLFCHFATSLGVCNLSVIIPPLNRSSFLAFWCQEMKAIYIKGKRRGEQRRRMDALLFHVDKETGQQGASFGVQ